MNSLSASNRSQDTAGAESYGFLRAFWVLSSNMLERRAPDAVFAMKTRRAVRTISIESGRNFASIEAHARLPHA
jgi:hypothetical protein